jgi:hypothetical protein
MGQRSGIDHRVGINEVKPMLKAERLELAKVVRLRVKVAKNEVGADDKNLVCAILTEELNFDVGKTLTCASYS